MPGHGAFLRFKFVFLITTLLALWFLSFAAVGTVSYTLYSHHKNECPPGQAREQLFGLWGECVISKGGTVKKLVREVQRRTVEDVCQDLSWVGASTGTHTYTHTEREKTPRYDLNDLWGGVGIIDFPWKDLEMHGVEREWGGADLHSNVYIHLKGRKELLTALWSRRALVCRWKLFLVENWSVLLLGLGIALGSGWPLFKVFVGELCNACLWAAYAVL